MPVAGPSDAYMGCGFPYMKFIPSLWKALCIPIKVTSIHRPLFQLGVEAPGCHWERGNEANAVGPSNGSGPRKRLGQSMNYSAVPPPQAPRAVNTPDAVVIGAGLKRVLSVSWRVSAMALDAGQVAGKAGKAGWGFAAIAHEILQLSRQLTDDMILLVDDVHGLLLVSARQFRAQRRPRWAATERHIGPGHARVRPRLEPLRKEAEARRQCVAGHAVRIESIVGKATRQSRLGLALSHSAKVEPACSEDFHGVLTQLAEQLGKVAIEVRNLMAVIGPREEAGGR